MSTEPGGARAALDPACVLGLDGDRAARLLVRAQPGARRSGFAGLWNGIPKVAVTSLPEKGRANEELADEIARMFGLRASAVSQVSGATSRAKAFRLECPPERVLARLGELLARSEEEKGR